MKVDMNADDLAKAVRSGDAHLRVDRVVVTAGTNKFRGAGVLRIANGKMHLDIILSGKTYAPDEKPSEWKETFGNSAASLSTPCHSWRRM